MPTWEESANNKNRDSRGPDFSLWICASVYFFDWWVIHIVFSHCLSMLPAWKYEWDSIDWGLSIKNHMFDTPVCITNLSVSPESILIHLHSNKTIFGNLVYICWFYPWKGVIVSLCFFYLLFFVPYSLFFHRSIECQGCQPIGFKQYGPGMKHLNVKLGIDYLDWWCAPRLFFL